MANHLGTRWRGKLPIPERAHPLVREFVAILNREQTTLTEVSDRTGLRRETMSMWRYRYTPGLADLQAALNAVGYELVIRQTAEQAATERRQMRSSEQVERERQQQHQAYLRRREAGYYREARP